MNTKKIIYLVATSTIFFQNVCFAELNNKHKLPKHHHAWSKPQSQVTKQVRSGTPAQIVAQQFISTTIQDDSCFFRAQPNSTGWVGPQQYIVATNQQIRSFNKFTGQPDGALDVNPASLMGIAISDFHSYFDRWGQRWIFMGGADTFDIFEFSQKTIAVTWSDGPIITKNTKWSSYQFPRTAFNSSVPPNTTYVDSPQLSSDQYNVYINPDIFGNPPLADVFLGVTAVVIPQSSFITGNTFTYTVFPDLFGPADFPVIGGIGFGPTPINFDSNPEFGYIVTAPQAPGGAQQDLIFTSLPFYRILNPASSSPSLSPLLEIPTPPFTSTFLAAHKGNLYGNSFPNFNGMLQISDGLDQVNVHIRNHQMYIVNVNWVDNTGTTTGLFAGGDRGSINWYQFDLTGDPTGKGQGTETATTIPALVQSGTIFDSSDAALTYWMPCIMTNKNGDLVICGNVSGADNYVQAFYVGRKASDPAGTLRDIVLLTTNTNAYNYGTLFFTDPNGQRWGDYNCVAPDPINDLDFWLSIQVVTGENQFGILSAQLIPN